MSTEVWRNGKWSIESTEEGAWYAVGDWWTRVLVTRKETADGPVWLFRSPVPAFVRRAAERLVTKGEVTEVAG